MIRCKSIIEDRRLCPFARKWRRASGFPLTTAWRSTARPTSSRSAIMANLVRERMHGDVTYFNVNRHINPTDVCVASCRLCAFGKQKRDPKAYTMSLEQVWETRGQGLERSHHRVPHRRRPASGTDSRLVLPDAARAEGTLSAVHLKAFTMVEIGYFARREKISVREVLERLRDAGMDSMPGGGAEVFCDACGASFATTRLTGDEWLDIARTAHEMGLNSNCTMLYGHIENEEDRVDHLVQLRALQDETHGFVTFIPLAFHPDNTALAHIPKTTGFDDSAKSRCRA